MGEWKKGDKARHGDKTVVVDEVEESGIVIVVEDSFSLAVDPDELELIAKPKPGEPASPGSSFTRTAGFEDVRKVYAEGLGVKPEVIEPVELNTIPGTVKVHLDSEEMRSLAELIKDGESFDLWMERLAGVDVLMVEVSGDHDPERWLIVGGGKVKLGR